MAQSFYTYLFECENNKVILRDLLSHIRIITSAFKSYEPELFYSVKRKGFVMVAPEPIGYHTQKLDNWSPDFLKETKIKRVSCYFGDFKTLQFDTMAIPTITDLDGKTLRITDLDAGIKQTEVLASYIPTTEFEKKRATYWVDLLEKLLELKSKKTCVK